MRTETTTATKKTNKPTYKLTREARLEAYEALHDLLHAPDDDKLAITAVITLQSLMHQKQRGGRHGC